MLGDALVFPTARSGWQKTVGVGGILLAVIRFGSVGVYRFVSWDRSLALDSVTITIVLTAVAMVLSGVALVGYHVRVFQSGVAVDSALPSFRPVRGLFSAGMWLCIVAFVYWVGVVTVISGLVWLFVGGALRSLIDGTGGGSVVVLSTIEQAGGLTTALVAVVLIYVSLAAITRFAYDSRIRAVVAIRSVLGIAFTYEFFVGFVLWAGIVLVLGLLGVALVPFVVGLFVVFYATVSATYALGRGYSAAIESEQ